jgi:hypothetical protein
VDTPTPYRPEKRTPPPTADELRARIPGWGADLDPRDRPSFPRERRDLPTGAHWDVPERQPDDGRREHSIEHGMLPPVFGTAQPLRGVSGAIRRYAYDRFGEGRAAHWLLLILGDRVEAFGENARSLATLRPDNPVTETGVLSELRRRPISSRFGRGRVDLAHGWIDPLLVAAPWIVAGALVVGALRSTRRR